MADATEADRLAGGTRASVACSIHTWERWDSHGDYGWTCLVCGRTRQDEPPVWVEPLVIPRVPDAVLPRDEHTQQVLAREVGLWWDGLTLAQRLYVYAVTPTVRGEVER